MQNQGYAEDFEALMALCRERNVAVQTIKSIAQRPWSGRQATRTTWYEPMEDQAEIDRAVHWVLSRPGIFLNTVGDIHVLPKVLDAANRFEAAPSDAEMSRQIEKLDMVPLFV
jgi:hypothetical protein